jgi:predicted small lipoprotein YifL
MPPMPLSRRGLLVIPILAVALQAGCGRKGPLYLPPPPPASSGPTEQAPPPPAAEVPAGAKSVR